MIRFFTLVSAFLAFAAPALAQGEARPQTRAEQNLAIAQSVQEQLLACWRLPPGYEDRHIAVRLAFFGDGSLDGEPLLMPESQRVAGKYPVLSRSVAAAIRACVPFEGLEGLGAGPRERFDITVNFRS